MTQPATARLRVRVQPNASRAEIAGWFDGALRVRTTASPVRGQANRAVAEMLARAMGIPQSGVSVVRGRGAREKIMEIVGIDDSEMLRRLDESMAYHERAAAPC